MPEPVANILLVEDNPGDVRLTRQALQDADFGCKVHVAEDGEQALAFLRQEGSYEDAQRPNLILLDLGLPKLDGREVLQAMKTVPELRRIPVVIFSTSLRREDVQNSYDRYANCYVVKPSDLDKFEDTVRTVAEFWLKHASLPQPVLSRAATK